MYSHADRFPAGEPLPQRPFSARPWGIARMAPYPPFETPTYTAIEIDPRTQVGRYLDQNQRRSLRVVPIWSRESSAEARPRA